MSTQLAATSGLDLNPIVMEEEITKEYQQSKTHYAFWYGTKPLPIQQVRCKKSKLRPGVIEQIDNFQYPDRRQAGGENADYNEGKPVASAMVLNAHGIMVQSDRKEEVWRTNRAGVICDDLELLFGNTRGDDETVGTGLVILRNLVDVPGKIIAAIAATLVPEPMEEDPTDPRKQRVKSAEAFRSMILAGRENYAPAVNTPEYRAVQRDTADLLLKAIDEGDAYMMGHLDQIKAEMENRRLPDGRGRGKFSRNEKEYMRLVGKSESDYLNDTRSAQNQLASQVVEILQAQPAAQGMSAETLATAFTMALKHVGLVPQPTPPPAPTVQTPQTPAAKPPQQNR